jgi:putative ABC transport system ATP-binding protein
MLRLAGITKYFHKGSVNEVLALDDVSLHVHKGDFVTIIGSNGAGKSSLLNCTAGTFLPDQGDVEMNRVAVTNWPEYKRARFVGRVFQDPLQGTCASMTIEQNMALALRRGKRRGLSLGVTGSDRRIFATELEKLGLGLEDRLSDVVGLLSGGQRQALTMLMATLVRPDILLLDEHTAALDPKTGSQILELTEQIVESQQLTTLMVTHNMHQALKLGNRLVMMHRGRVIMDIQGEEKASLKVEDLLARFYNIKGEAFSSDRVLLS